MDTLGREMRHLISHQEVMDAVFNAAHGNEPETKAVFVCHGKKSEIVIRRYPRPCET
jgi:hypothetical protein